MESVLRLRGKGKVPHGAAGNDNSSKPKSNGYYVPGRAEYYNSSIQRHSCYYFTDEKNEFKEVE